MMKSKSMRYYVVVAMIWSVMPALVQATKDAARPVCEGYLLDAKKHHYEWFNPEELHAELEKLRAVGNEDPYALVLLKEMINPADRGVRNHLTAVQQKEKVCKAIFQTHKVLNENMRMNCTTRAIVGVAVVMEESSVLVATPEWFESKRVQ